MNREYENGQDQTNQNEKSYVWDRNILNSIHQNK